MKYKFTSLAIAALAIVFAASTAQAQVQEKEKAQMKNTLRVGTTDSHGPRFIDNDGDGICDNPRTGAKMGRNGKGGHGPGDGTGNKGIGPRDGSGYGPGSGTGNCDGTGPKGIRRGKK